MPINYKYHFFCILSDIFSRHIHTLKINFLPTGFCFSKTRSSYPPEKLHDIGKSTFWYRRPEPIVERMDLYFDWLTGVIPLWMELITYLWLLRAPPCIARGQAVWSTWTFWMKHLTRCLFQSGGLDISVETKTGTPLLHPRKLTWQWKKQPWLKM